MKFSFNHRMLILVLLGSIGFLSACVFFIVRLDYVIHHDLYGYGLQFSEEWATQIWIFKDLTLIFSGVGILVNIFGLIYVFTAKPSRLPQLQQKAFTIPAGFTQKLSLILLGTGVVSLATSILYNSTAAAFVGLGLIFWGIIFLYVRTGKYVKASLLDKTTLSALKALEGMIGEADFEGQAVYLPPKYLKDFESSRFFISKAKGTTLPDQKEFLTQSNEILIDNPKGISFEPPGAEITRLLEQALNTSFTKTNLQSFEQKIPTALIEDLEIAQNVQIEKQGQNLSIKLENSIYASMCSETQKLTKINGSIGCPICSALACALAKTTGKPITIKREQPTLDDHTINTEYRMLEEK